ncbi:hypothetical protein AA101099_0401 [Neoasaia chiangmaiensis NBRC 101099]|uniref:hypothetical protein n=1 Tax=Neoasaia chiangmaiensis TaxID=320497 RepID=UPI0011941BD7|nr:hypothetical protein [Neoasaia chiangmaiensis]GBR36556.1 hypothetical protein AA101099_0401 [Neoasaia chiangmaiensis NBRC 101099]GEN15303.1 hypothetical protein NCH01_17340 [Neoasaia chiangmaiensis]
MTPEGSKPEIANDNGSAGAELTQLVTVLARAVGRSVAQQQFEAWLKTTVVVANDNQPKEQREQKS